MQDWLVVIAVVGTLVLGALWVVHLRAHLRRRAAVSQEWGSGEDGEEGGDLWSSAARCIRCHGSPVVLRRDEGDLFHDCLRCGHREARQHFG